MSAIENFGPFFPFTALSIKLYKFVLFDQYCNGGLVRIGFGYGAGTGIGTGGTIIGGGFGTNNYLSTPSKFLLS